MSQAEEETIKKFISLGLSEQKAKETLKNANVTKYLLAATKEVGTAQLTGGAGLLVYHLATKLKPQVLPRLPLLVEYITSGRLDTTLRVDAALQFLLGRAGDANIDRLALDEACGVGVEVSPEQVEAAVETEMAKHMAELLEKSYRGRSINFCDEETTRLQQMLYEHKDVLLCKKTDTVTSKRKEEAWVEIERKFNAVGDRHRTMKQLKHKFDNMKRAANKNARKERQEKCHTGGGPPDCNADDVTHWFGSIIPTALDGGDAFCDDVVIAEALPIINFVPSTSKQNVDDRTMSIAEEDVTTIFDSSNPRKPMSSLLNRKRIKKTFRKKLSAARKDLHKKKKEVLLARQAAELQYWDEKRKQQQELHDQTLRHNAEKHELEMIILKAKLTKE